MTLLLLAIIYLAFISLGLPDALLGAAWPVMYPNFRVPIAYAGWVAMIIAVGTVVSSLLSDRLTKKLGTSKVTACSVAMTAFALFGFSFSRSFYVLCFWAIPYGLGAGSVDASLNNYVALHYTSRHMSWLHCMWGVGASLGPLIMGAALTYGPHWQSGYRRVAFIQLALTVILFLSLPLWKKIQGNQNSKNRAAVPNAAAAESLRQVVRIPGVKAVMMIFFSYSAIEQTTGLWISSYLVLNRRLDAGQAAVWASLFFLAITIGRALSGFISIKLNDAQMVRLGLGITLLGILILLVSAGQTLALLGLMTIGLGCAPVFPCLIHATPAHFGPEHSQAVIGIQMASCYAGTCLMPPLFGLIAENFGAVWLPAYLFLALLCMVAMHVRLLRVVSRNSSVTPRQTAL